VTDSPILRLWYSPFPTTAGLRSARIDSSLRYLNLVFQLVVNSFVQIELFDQTSHGRQILFQREMAAGCYSQTVTAPADWKLKATDFCRLELKTAPGTYSFIQIQPIRGLSDKTIAGE
ncbi:hypothetical protein L0128_08630, partial [candidate division KSB1 bacterium]|nr:hypothetical protein [candidate division KSB1 bacterium]